jgi:large subunit ribosomal protein L13
MRWCDAQKLIACLCVSGHNAKRTDQKLFVLVAFDLGLSPPPSSFGVDLARLTEPRFFCHFFVFSIDRLWGNEIKSSPFSNLRPIFQDGTHMKTFSAKPHEVKREWFVVDATDKVLGRLATEIARRLRGKHKAIYTPHVDTGDFIVVTNVEKLTVTGNKAEDKKYFRHSGYPGGIYETNFKKMQQRFPGRALEKAVKGMLPKGPLGYAMLKKLKCYAGDQHPHTAQQPKALEI